MENLKSVPLNTLTLKVFVTRFSFLLEYVGQAGHNYLSIHIKLHVLPDSGFRHVLKFGKKGSSGNKVMKIVIDCATF